MKCKCTNAKNIKCKIVQSFWKIVWQLLKKVNVHLWFYPTISFQDLYSRYESIYPHKKLHTIVYKRFVIARNWKQPKCPSIGDWINKWRYSHVSIVWTYLSNKRKNNFNMQGHGSQKTSYAKWKKQVKMKMYCIYSIFVRF